MYNMKTIFFYHIYLDDHGYWSSIVNEQMSAIQAFGLMDVLDEMHITCVSNDYAKTKWFSTLTRSYFRNADIEEVQNPFVDDLEMLNSYPNFTKGSSNKNTETYTLKKLYDASKQDAKIMYLHARGITFFLRTMIEAKNNNTKYIYDNQYDKLCYLSRQFHNWVNIENWKTIHKALDTYDIAGGNYQLFPAPNFGGNLWWANSKYVRNLADPSDISWWRNLQSRLPDDNPLKSGFSASDRFRDEFWISSNPHARVYKLIDMSPDENPIKKIITKDMYANKPINGI